MTEKHPIILESMNFPKVNYLLRGMEVPKGNYDIHFTYKPKIIMTGSIFVIFGSIILLISLFIYIKKILKHV